MSGARYQQAPYSDNEYGGAGYDNGGYGGQGGYRNNECEC